MKYPDQTQILNAPGKNLRFHVRRQNPFQLHLSIISCEPVHKAGREENLKGTRPIAISNDVIMYFTEIQKKYRASDDTKDNQGNEQIELDTTSERILKLRTNCNRTTQEQPENPTGGR